MKPPKVLDNKKYRVVDELKEELNKGSKLSVISSYFTIYAYAELKKELSRIAGMRFLFKEPSFVKKDEEEEKRNIVSSTYVKNINIVINNKICEMSEIYQN